MDGGPPTATLAPIGVARSSFPIWGRARPASGTVTLVVDDSAKEEEEEEETAQGQARDVGE